MLLPRYTAKRIPMAEQQPVIQSLLDTDLYKFTMLQVVLHQFPQASSIYKFRCHNNDTAQYPLREIKDELEHQLDYLCELRFQPDELDYLRSLRFIKSDFVDYLELFQLKRRFIQVAIDEQGRLDIHIQGPMVQAMFFEIFVLALVNQIFFTRFHSPAVFEEGERRLQEKIALLQQIDQQQNPQDPPFLIADFGTRRRFTRTWHEHVVRTLVNQVPHVVRGTSNVYLAKQLGITPIGTMAHEYLQAFQALNVRLRDFQKKALEAWVQEYRGDLGVALTDVITMDAFLADFDLYFAKLFDGLRHDSGDPYIWGEKAIAHYQKLKINPASKRFTFSDGLNIPKAFKLHQHFKNRVQTSFGIGTNLTNDMGLEPLKIVLKLVSCNGQTVAKISDSQGKIVCSDETFMAYLKQVFNVI